MDVYQKTIEADGVITFWSLSSHSNRDEMTARLGAIHPDLAKVVPEERTLRTGLMYDALKDVFPGREGYVVRVLPKKNGWVVKQEVVEDDDVTLRYVCHVKVETIDSNGSPKDVWDIKRGYTSELTDKISDAIDKQRGLAPASQVSEMLTKILKSDAFPGVVSLRPSGGIYVLTDDNTKKVWAAVAKALLGCGANGRANKVYRVDYKLNEYSIEAIRDALLEEVSLFASNLESEINETDPDKQLGARALKNRQREAEEMLKRVEFLEGALSTRLQDARDLVDKVKTAAGTAALLSTCTV